MTWDATTLILLYFYTFFIRMTQIANKSTILVMLGLGVSCSLNRVKMYIIFSRLVWTKSL